MTQFTGSIILKHAFLTVENINQIISNNGISGDIGLLSIDVDGNDYWLWEATKCISPNIVVIEFNALFGKKEMVSVPYKEDFVWTNEHFLIYTGEHPWLLWNI